MTEEDPHKAYERGYQDCCEEVVRTISQYATLQQLDRLVDILKRKRHEVTG